MGRAETLPALMKERDAAWYLGVSPSTLRGLDIPRKVLGALRLYDRRDLDDFAARLPYEGEAAPPRDRVAEWLEANG